MQRSFSSLAHLYKSSLVDDVIPFWTRHSIDHEHGGYFTCLARDGSVFDTDKFVWLQARQVWTYSMLYNRLEQRDDWLEIARHGADFISRHAVDDAGNWYFALDRAGAPLIQPYNIFSDCFAAMAFAQHSLAAGDDSAANLAKRTYDNVLARASNPKGAYEKAVPGSRPLKGFALPMILCNLTMELEPLLPSATVEEQINRAIHEIMDIFLDGESMLVRENVAPGGEPVDSFKGRLVNPGHAIEAMWFVMEIGRRRGDQALITRAVDVTLAMLEYGWDNDFGGIYYFLDRLGRPVEQLEWNQKLWWVHLEALVALAIGCELTGRDECRQWYDRVHDYAWSRFPDPESGEWYGYLDRRGEVLLPLKGGKWKGCFHLPRALFQCWKAFEAASGAAVRNGTRDG